MQFLMLYSPHKFVRGEQLTIPPSFGSKSSDSLHNHDYTFLQFFPIPHPHYPFDPCVSIQRTVVKLIPLCTHSFSNPTP